MGHRIIGATLGVVLGWLGVVGTTARADTSQTHMTRLDDRSTVVHAIPRRNTQVKMLAERVVLVPFWHRASGEPRMLVHVWYDFAGASRPRSLSVGFPELKAVHHFERYWIGGAGGMFANNVTGVDYNRRLPSISQFSARVGKTWLPVSPHPGIGRYRRWFVYALPLVKTGKVRLHNVYVARLGRSLDGRNVDQKPPQMLMVGYWFNYLLHTGASWHGPIGRGEVLLYGNGQHHVVKRFTQLEPTKKDDVYLELNITRTLTPPSADGEIFGSNGLDKLQLVQASSHRQSKEVDSVGPLVVDGDVATQWVSAPRSALGAWVQVPAGERSLVGVEIHSGPKVADQERPARVTILCVSRRNERKIMTAKLPDGAGPHRLSFPTVQDCHAVRCRIDDVHGNRRSSVAVAELRLLPKYPKIAAVAPFTLKSAHPKADRLAKLSPKRPGAKAKLPAAGSQSKGWEIARVSSVRWSPDGSVVYYQLWLENEQRNVGGVVMGFFVDVATGKVLRAVGLDRLGTLRAPYARWWAERLTLDEAEAFMRRHRFVKAESLRWSPRRASLKGVRLSLQKKIERTQGLLKIQPRSTGFRWVYWPNKAVKPKGATNGMLTLIAQIRGQGKKTLWQHKPALDHAFAVRHEKVRAARRKIVGLAATEFSRARAGYVHASAKDPGRTWHSLYYKTIHAFTGDVRVYWPPTGKALLVVRLDRQEWSSTTPDPKAQELVPECAQLSSSVCPWERLDYGRSQVVVSVHPLVPTKPTTLQIPAPPPARSPAKKPPTMQRRPSAGKAMRQQAMAGESKKSTSKKKSGGCGCQTPGGPPLFVSILLLICYWLRRRLVRR